MQEQLLELWSATRKTILFITHSIDEAVYMANRVVVMGARPGRIVEEIDVDLPRPRGGGVRAPSRFGEIRAYAWEILKKGIREAAELTTVTMTAIVDNAARAELARIRRRRSIVCSSSSVTLIGFLALWEIVGRLSNPLFFAPVSDVLREFWLGLLDPRASLLNGLVETLARSSAWICRSPPSSASRSGC